MKPVTLFIVACALYSCSPRQAINSGSLSNIASTGTFSNNRGISFDDAVVVTGVTTQRDVMAAEYHYISSQRGLRGKDWFLVGQTIIADKSKVVDVVEIQLNSSSERQIIYFDATSIFIPEKADNALSVNIP
jgi:hypothetical protein